MLSKFNGREEILLSNIWQTFIFCIISYHVKCVTMIPASHHLVSPHSCLLGSSLQMLTWVNICKAVSTDTGKSTADALVHLGKNSSWTFNQQFSLSHHDFFSFWSWGAHLCHLYCNTVLHLFAKVLILSDPCLVVLTVKFFCMVSKLCFFLKYKWKKSKFIWNSKKRGEAKMYTYESISQISMEHLYFIFLNSCD